MPQQLPNKASVNPTEQQLVAHKRYVKALAAGGFNARTSSRLWALYRLGCFRTILDTAVAMTTAKDALAILVAAAACGNVVIMNQALDDFLYRDDGSLALEACQRVAPFNLNAAFRIASKFALSPVLLESLSNHLPVRCTPLQITESDAETDGDAFLLLANAADPLRALRLVNRFLSAEGVSEVALVNPLLPVSANNLHCPERSLHRGPLVTILMTTFNSASTLKSAAHSILAQSYQDIELIIVDDASFDNTPALIRELAATDPRIKPVLLAKNVGTYAAKNKGLRVAKGEFVTCNDSDDWSHRDRIWEQVSPLLEDEKLTCTTSEMVRVTHDGKFVSRHIYPLKRLNTSSLMFRRELVLRRAGYYHNVRIGADSEFHARLKLVFGKSANMALRKPLAFVTQSQNSLTSDIRTGQPLPEARLTYWETWTRRHVDWQRFKLLRSFGRIAFIMP